MLHTKFHGNLLAGSGGDFLIFLTKDVNECSNIRLFVFFSNIRIRFLNSNIRIFSVPELRTIRTLDNSDHGQFGPDSDLSCGQFGPWSIRTSNTGQFGPHKNEVRIDQCFFENRVRIDQGSRS